jgi:dCMP deaminase
MTDWNKRFIGLAEHVSGWSKDHSTKTGAVIVGPDKEILSIGFNGFPRGCDGDVDERHERPAKYSWTEHSERNAIYNAARIGVSLKDSTIYMLWYPCADCARAIAQAGIARMVCQPHDKAPDKTKDGWQFEIATLVLEEAGAEIVVL